MFLVTYDVASNPKDPHQAILSEAHLAGWSTWANSERYEARLPNTTMIGEFADLDDARRAFRYLLSRASILVGYSVETERHLVVQYSAGFIRSNDKVPRQK
jgi:hypothetical protein